MNALIVTIILIAVVLYVASTKGTKPTNQPPQSRSTKRYQHEAMALAAMECFPDSNTPMTYAQIDEAIQNTGRGLSKARRADRIQGMIQTGMIRGDSDGTFNRTMAVHD